METIKISNAPRRSSQSTFLVGEWFVNRFLYPNSLKGKRLAEYLHKILEDPDLESKIRKLRAKKWKKQYQEDGQSLVPLFFYPDEVDWARLSQISNATGFSRCYIFVYLMLLDMGFLKLRNNRTKVHFTVKTKNIYIYSGIFLDVRTRILKRQLKTQPEPDSD